MGKNQGSGYKNIIPTDKKVHSDAGRGIRQPQKVAMPIYHKEEKYQGWSNRETWAVKLHWDNNVGDYNYFTGTAKRFLKEGKPSYEFADFLKQQAEEIEESVYEGNASEEAKNFMRDVGSLWRVDWDEIAKAYYEDIKSDEK